MQPRAVLDARPLQAGFKAHAERGIGRYSKNLINALIASGGLEEIKLLTQANLPHEAIPPGPECLKAGYMPLWLPRFKRLASHYWLARKPVQPYWRKGWVVHFLCHLDAPLLPGPGTVVTVHDLIAQRLEKLYRQRVSGFRFQVERWLETRVLFKADKLIAVSEQTKSDLVELYGLEPSRIAVVHEGPDPGLAPVKDPAAIAGALYRCGLDPKEPYFLYLGGIDQRKGTEYLLEALAMLRDKGLPHTLALAGRIEGDKQYPLLVEQIKKLGLAGKVKLLGFVADADLPALFSGCLGFVFPSLYEGFGLPPLEAMACGAPVVAANASAVPEVVGGAGLLVEPANAAALAQAMEGLARNPELALDLREKGYKRAEAFSWDKAARKTLAVYGEARKQ